MQKKQVNTQYTIAITQYEKACQVGGAGVFSVPKLVSLSAKGKFNQLSR